MQKIKAVNQQVEYSYDALHRLTSVRCGDEAPIHYAYDAADNLVAAGTEVESALPKAGAASQEPAPAKTGAATQQAEVTEDKAAPAPQWYLHRQGQQYGPYTQQQLLQWARKGELQPHDLLWHPDLPEWTRAAAIPELGMERV